MEQPAATDRDTNPSGSSGPSPRENLTFSSLFELQPKVIPKSKYQGILLIQVITDILLIKVQPGPGFYLGCALEPAPLSPLSVGLDSGPEAPYH